MNETICCTTCCDIDNILAFFIASFIVGTVSFIILELISFKWDLKNRSFCSNKEGVKCLWFKYFIIFLILYIPFSYVVKFIVYLII